MDRLLEEGPDPSVTFRVGEGDGVKVEFVLSRDEPLLARSCFCGVSDRLSLVELLGEM